MAKSRQKSMYKSTKGCLYSLFNVYVFEALPVYSLDMQNLTANNFALI